jgi:hypothetical protein
MERAVFKEHFRQLHFSSVMSLQSTYQVSDTTFPRNLFSLAILKHTELIVMAVGYARPDVADMVLRVFERSVHPELFDTVCETHVGSGDAKVTLRLGRSGHLIEYRTKHSTLVEIVTSKFAPLPSQLCSIDRRLIGYRTHTVEGQGVRYHCSYQLESAPVDLYLALHRELETDARTSTLAAAIPGASTASPDCLSLLKCDLLPEGLVVHAFHTFPENSAVLRIQTLFERL